MRTPGAQILSYKCHFPLKGTKAPGEMAGSRVWSRESEKKVSLEKSHARKWPQKPIELC